VISRRSVTKVMTAGAATASLQGLAAPASAAGSDASTQTGKTPNPLPDLGPLHQVRTELLEIGYHEAGPSRGHKVILCHGWPYSPDAYREVVPLLARQGFHVFVPYLRGFGPTRFLKEDSFRSGEQAALASDVVDFMDALHIRRALFGGYDWGGGALSAVAALWPDRCDGLVAVNSYLIQNLNPAAVVTPNPSDIESVHFYFYWFLTQNGASGLRADPKAVARTVWTRNSPGWNFTENDLNRAAQLFSNPDYVDIVIHNYRRRLLQAPGDPRYADVVERLLQLPPIPVPAVTLDGLTDTSFPPTDGTSSASHFIGPRVHHQVPRAGHNLPQEQPKAFADAIREVTRLR
jgi:pimeloyl-ACP methyl ester carboxylesterase